MSFDIQQPVFSPDGEYLEDAAMQYRDVLIEGFAESAEGQELVRQGGTIGWADTLMELGMGYLEVTPATMKAEHMKEVLFELFPRKVSAEPGCGQEIVTELRAFWEFLQREYSLVNAEACLRVLTTATARRLEQAMQDPANFGLAKAFVMQGWASGFDMSTPEGMQAWADTYNAGLRINAPRPVEEVPRASSTTGRATRTATAARRKLAQRSRRINRKKR
ncbi:MAG: hypothetical protein JO352_03700 [Chloroflexi bacterium]|nr:hypothetical protein [Chloroflexota bacterium]MBV9602672.1 hypothetical protein [Chloroflexota bacterium]